MESLPILIYACAVLQNFCKLECSHLDKNLVRKQTEHNKAEEEKLKNIPDPVCSCKNGEDEFVSFVLTSYIHDNLLDDLV